MRRTAWRGSARSLEPRAGSGRRFAAGQKGLLGERKGARLGHRLSPRGLRTSVCFSGTRETGVSSGFLICPALCTHMKVTIHILSKSIFQLSHPELRAVSAPISSPLSLHCAAALCDQGKMFASWLVGTAQAVPPPPPPLGSGGSENASCLWEVTQDGLVLDNSSLAVLDIVFSTIGPPEEVKKFRVFASKPNCEGIVLVEPPWDQTWNKTCNTDVYDVHLPSKFRRASVPTCVRLMGSRGILAANTRVLVWESSHLTNPDVLARKIERVSFGIPASCHLKVTTVPLLGCRKGDDLKHTDERIDDLNNTDGLVDVGLVDFLDHMFAKNGTPTDTDKQTRSQFITWAKWILLSLCMLPAAGIDLTYRHYSRRSANLLLSRDRAQFWTYSCSPTR